MAAIGGGKETLRFGENFIKNCLKCIEITFLSESALVQDVNDMLLQFWRPVHTLSHGGR